jgi:hypothetical protein
MRRPAHERRTLHIHFSSEAPKGRDHLIELSGKGVISIK